MFETMLLMWLQIPCIITVFLFFSRPFVPFMASVTTALSILVISQRAAYLPDGISFAIKYLSFCLIAWGICFMVSLYRRKHGNSKVITYYCESDKKTYRF